jgi:hypothetical protein
MSQCTRQLSLVAFLEHAAADTHTLEGKMTLAWSMQIQACILYLDTSKKDAQAARDKFSPPHCGKELKTKDGAPLKSYRALQPAPLKQLHTGNTLKCFNYTTLYIYPNVLIRNQTSRRAVRGK